MKIHTALSTCSLALVTLPACSPAPTADTASPPAVVEQRPSIAAGQAFLLAHEEAIGELIGRMTLDEKVGQMTQADMSYLQDEADITKYFLGSVLSGGGSDPAAGNSPEAWRAMYDRFQQRALATRLRIPLLYGVDAVHGHANVLGAVVFPHHIGLGATRNPELVEAVYRATALEVRATGINWDFAPCVAVARDPRWGRTYESFSEDPEVVASLAGAAVRGLQGPGLGHPEAVVACAKHWVGDGGTTFGTGAPREVIPDSVFAGGGDAREQTGRWPLDRGDTRVDEATLRAVHVPGYLEALRAGVATIMPSFSSWNGQKLSGSRYLLTTVLKEELGFQGFLISDWAAIDEIEGDYASDIETSINAGMDMVMVPERYVEFFETLKRLVEEGRVPMSRIEDAVRRILRVKFAAGLFDEKRSPLADPALAGNLGRAEHRALARRAVRESLVLLRNEKGTLPLRAGLRRIHVAGRNADDLGNQCGGWTIEWQGASGAITEGTTILEAIRDAAGEAAEVTFSVDGSGGEGADVVVVVIGETPYAEMLGDRSDLALDPNDVATLERAIASGADVVAVVVSGRPLALPDALVEGSKAIVAAWLPGSEGEGVADVLFGSAPPRGKLGFRWPRAAGEEPLYPLGHGLSY